MYSALSAGINHVLGNFTQSAVAGSSVTRVCLPDDEPVLSHSSSVTQARSLGFNIYQIGGNCKRFCNQHSVFINGTKCLTHLTAGNDEETKII